jgi:hypothetical protein
VRENGPKNRQKITKITGDFMDQQTDDTPNPGSVEAIAMECTCPILDNGRGRGSGMLGSEGQPLFWIADDCPLHGQVKHTTGCAVPVAEAVLPDTKGGAN